MSEEISGLQATSRLTSKRQASMESVQNLDAMQPSQAMKQLEEMQAQVDYAFSLMHEVRGKLESAYRELSPSK